jgi:hypothetical protein
LIATGVGCSNGDAMREPVTMMSAASTSSVGAACAWADTPDNIAIASTEQLEAVLSALPRPTDMNANFLLAFIQHSSPKNLLMFDLMLCYDGNVVNAVGISVQKRKTNRPICNQQANHGSG